MVKLIILDVDGVIVGGKPGINFPNPNQKVILALKKVRQRDIPVVLCTGKYHFAIEPIIQKAQLDNPHITDSGALIYNPLANKIIHEFTLDKNVVSNIISVCLGNNIHIEAYTTENFFIQKNQVKEILPFRIKILQRNPILVGSLIKFVKQQDIIKLLPIVTNDQDRKKLQDLLKPYSNQASFVWSMHPATKPWQYLLITAKAVSKAIAVKEIAKNFGISLENTLGVGDTLGDWEFMKLCGYVAAMANGSEELINLTRSKEEGKYLIAPSVDEDGILKVFEYFLKSAD